MSERWIFRFYSEPPLYNYYYLSYGIELDAYMETEIYCYTNIECLCVE